MIGVSSQAAAHLTLVPALQDALAAAFEGTGVAPPLVCVGGVIPAQGGKRPPPPVLTAPLHPDYDFLYKHGVACIFGPGTQLPVAAGEVPHSRFAPFSSRFKGVGGD
jgi:methylmalonyl-CoA mutase